MTTIANELYISRSTVQNHLTTIVQKFGVHTQAELIELLRRPKAGGIGVRRSIGSSESAWATRASERANPCSHRAATRSGLGGCQPAFNQP